MIELRHTLLPVPVRPAIKQVRQRREVDGHRVAGDVFAKVDRDLHLLGLAVRFLDHFAEADELAVFVRHFDADGVLAGDRGDDADARHAEGDGQVVGQARDLRQAQAGFQLDFVLGDDRAGFDFHDADVEAEVLERLFEDLRFAADFFFVLFVADVFVRRAAVRAAAVRSRFPRRIARRLRAAR